MLWIILSSGCTQLTHAAGTVPEAKPCEEPWQSGLGDLPRSTMVAASKDNAVAGTRAEDLSPGPP